jgi:hypothetical protein
VKNQTYESGGLLEVKIHILFYRYHSITVAFRQMNFGSVKKVKNVSTSGFIWIIIKFEKSFKYGDGANC